MSFETLAVSEIKVGDKLPQLNVELTASMIVGGALASHDFTPVHHDRNAAQASGMNDVFMNILTTNGFVGRYVTDWAGADAMIKQVSIKLGGPNLPGDTMKMTGEVQAVDASTGEIEVKVDGNNSWGSHVTGTVSVLLPTGA